MEWVRLVGLLDKECFISMLELLVEQSFIMVQVLGLLLLLAFIMVEFIAQVKLFRLELLIKFMAESLIMVKFQESSLMG